MTALDTALENPDIERIFLAHVTAWKEFKSWTFDTGFAYYTTGIAFADDSTFGRSFEIVDVSEDGTELRYSSVIAGVQFNKSRFFYDKAADRLYVSMADGLDPTGRLVLASYHFFLSDKPRILSVTIGFGITDVLVNVGNIYYEPRLDTMPNLSLRIEDRFSGIPQIGGGNVSFKNEDGFFDKISDLRWDAGKTLIKLGVDFNGIMIYDNYETIGKWLNDTTTKTDSKFSISLKEPKIRTKKKIPATLYDRDTYPLMRQDDVGRAVQIAYGNIKDAPAVTIDEVAGQFKVAGHAIISFDGVRVKNENDEWITKSFATTDIANGEFTLSLSDWVSDQDVAVDFTGKVKSGTTPMDNPSDIVKDILETYLGEPTANLNATSFTDAYNAFDNGSVFNTAKRRTIGRIGIYIDAPMTAKEIISLINYSAGAYLFTNLVGEYFYKAFLPPAGEGLAEFDDKEIKSFSEITKTNIVSKCIVKYDKRIENDWSEVYTYEDLPKQYLSGEPGESLLEKEIPLSETEDAQRWAQTQINYEGNPGKKYTLTVPMRRAAKLLPADFIRLVYARHSIDGTFEVLEVSHNLRSDTTTLVIGDMHGLKERPGWWAIDSPVFPASLGGGAASPWSAGWSDAQKTWAKQNVGYWCDDNGLALTADPESYDVSTWI